MHQRPTVAVWKFASCDGCQLVILNCEAELLTIADRVDIRWFPEASSAMIPGPVDVSFVEGSVTTAHDIERIHEIRRNSGLLITIGACATGGGVQALRNGLDTGEILDMVYADPQYISTLDASTPIARHVPVDIELRGCAIDKGQFLETISALLSGRPPRLPRSSVCLECKASAQTCVMVANATPCVGPLTMAGCGAICPSVGRGCFGCFGPMENPNPTSLVSRFAQLGMSPEQSTRLLRGVCDLTGSTLP
jgi:coenzyme F420-reducing hydrogenase gamma subunit